MRVEPGLVAALALGALFGCQLDPLHQPTPDAGNALDPPLSGAPDPIDYPGKVSLHCTFTATDARWEPVETRCDGIDNDCDGLIDFLLPVEANACETGRPGICAAGHYACDPDGRRICIGPGPTPEVLDGLDNDCNGTIDDVPAARARPRVRMVVPQYLWSEGDEELLKIASTLDQWGVPYDLPVHDTDWASDLAALSLEQESVVIVPGYLDSGVVTPLVQRQLESFAASGGVVLVTKPIAYAAGATLALSLVGASTSARRRNALQLRFDGVAPAFASFDAPEERFLDVAEDLIAGPVEVYTFVLDPSAHTTTIAVAVGEAGRVLGPAMIRRPVGRGAIYGLGHELQNFAQNRCYVNCFEPAADTLGLLLRDAVREGAQGHVVFKHTMPGAEDSALLLTHDVDAPDAQNHGIWGLPGAIQAAQVEQRHGARGTYFVTTDYINGYWNPAVVTELCARGMCPIAAHSVRHLPTFQSQPHGSCTETPETYGAGTPETLCGEVQVSLELLEQVSGHRPRAWRSPYLYVHADQFPLLWANGVVADSSYAVGDFKTNLPFQTDRYPLNQELFQHQPLTEFPMVLEDGIGFVDGAGHTERIELQADNVARFISEWSYAMLRNKDNRAATVALIHPSYGRGVEADNLALKMAASDRMLAVANEAGLIVDWTVEEFADFWRGRDAVALDARYDARGYHGTLIVGPLPARNFTLEFGDRIGGFSCATCGTTEVIAKRVVFRTPLVPGAHHSFDATVR